MLCRALIVSLSLVGTVVAVAAEQQRLSQFEWSDQGDAYKFKWPITKVAIISAGVSGLIAYREFTAAGFEHVHVFEWDDMPGGNWHYSDETPLDAPILNVDLAVGDFVLSLPPRCATLPVTEHYDSGWEARWREHRAPKPIWESLESVDPPPIQQITEIPWPHGTPWPLPHWTVACYLRTFASFHGANSNDVNPDIAYNTRVEHVEKHYNVAGQEHGWVLTLKRLERTGQHPCKATWWNKDFDAIVVATGRYNTPNIPSISGLEDWVNKFPGSVMHSCQYRRSQPFINETILVVGGSTSGIEITREINLIARKVYQSLRDCPNPHLPYGVALAQLNCLPANVSVVPEILVNGTVGLCLIPSITNELISFKFLHAISRVVFATGFRYSFPFLPQFHNSSASASRHPIITDGTHLRSLYEDFLSINEPTIGFLNMNWGGQTFTYIEHLSLALAKIWACKAVLPGTATMWHKYQNQVKERGGYGRQLQFLGSKCVAENIHFFVAWLNDAAVKFGGRQVRCDCR
ncbi:FAD/NAD(P)-binding domain-containing protein [Mycena maculata]|uniref:FAD/NAD(P)-binding domain-containing protein n=1 Tax=Mycena maculata TaxID=230809 RepID=A0AAD7HPV6_9AGAR|nr:FAD/NAD(P)-binding domain-containing protein [Mycena maculata]